MASDIFCVSWIIPDLDRDLVIQSKYLPWSITICYIVFTMVIGPSIMKNRKPMDLQHTMLVYNFLLLACNAYLSAHVIMVAVERWPHRCNIESGKIRAIMEAVEIWPHHCNNESGKMRPIMEAVEMWPHRCNIESGKMRKYYYLCCFGLFVKFLELFITVIFILRKKFQQVSFLHVYHHAIIFILLWMALKFQLIGYYVILFGAINFSVHVAVYLYYALAALGPGVRKYLWWKKYLTTLQIVEFFAIMTYMTYSAVTGCDKYYKFDNIVFAAVAINAALFINFYVRTYNTTELLR